MSGHTFMAIDANRSAFHIHMLPLDLHQFSQPAAKKQQSSKTELHIVMQLRSEYGLEFIVAESAHWFLGYLGLGNRLDFVNRFLPDVTSAVCIAEHRFDENNRHSHCVVAVSAFRCSLPCGFPNGDSLPAPCFEVSHQRSGNITHSSLAGKCNEC